MVYDVCRDSRVVNVLGTSEATLEFVVSAGEKARLLKEEEEEERAPNLYRLPQMLLFRLWKPTAASDCLRPAWHVRSPEYFRLLRLLCLTTSWSTILLVDWCCRSDLLLGTWHIYKK